jgi:hypothetical protein
MRVKSGFGTRAVTAPIDAPTVAAPATAVSQRRRGHVLSSASTFGEGRRSPDSTRREVDRIPARARCRHGSAVSIRPVLRLRAALEQASRRRWLAVFIALLLVLLLALSIGHDAEHAVGEAAVSLVRVVVLTTVARLPTRPGFSRGVGSRSERAPPLPLRLTPHPSPPSSRDTSSTVEAGRRRSPSVEGGPVVPVRPSPP